MEGLIILKVEVKRFEVFLELMSFGLFRAPNYYFVKVDELFEPFVVKAVTYEALCKKLLST